MMINPALTAEEWVAKKAEYGRYTISLYVYGEKEGEGGTELQVCSDYGQDMWSRVPDELMAKATALCLHSQPYGFEYTDVLMHRWKAGECRDRDKEFTEGISMWALDAIWHDSMADRIEALLPPETE